MIEVINQWWWAVALSAAASISILNAVSKYWGTHSPGLRKAMAFVVEILSILVSKGAQVGQGPLRAFKLPGQLVPPAAKGQADDR